MVQGRPRLAGMSCVAALLVVAGCGTGQTVSVSNDGASVVTVRYADGDLGEVQPGGGVVVHTDDCLSGPLLLGFEGGRVLEVAGSACPGQRLLIDDEGAELVAEPDQG